MVCAVLVLVVVGVFAYWERYLLGPSDGAVERGPYLVRLDRTRRRSPGRLATARRSSSARCRPNGHAGRRTRRHASRGCGPAPTTPGRRPSVARRGVGQLDDGTPHALAADRVRRDRRLRLRQRPRVGSGHVCSPPDARLRRHGGRQQLPRRLPLLLDRNIFEPLSPVMGNAPLRATFGEHDTFWRNGRRSRRPAHPRQGRPVHSPLRPGADRPARVTAAERAPSRSRSASWRAPARGCGSSSCTARFCGATRSCRSSAAGGGRLRGPPPPVRAPGRRRPAQFVVGTGGEGPGDERFTKATPDALTRCSTTARYGCVWTATT